MKTGHIVKVKYEGKCYVGEIINIRKHKNYLLFIIDKLPQIWFCEQDIERK